MAANPKHIPSPAVGWITLRQWCELTGETEKAVRRRREKGIWYDGRHTRLRDRRIWVNYEAAQEWVETGR